jgi:hypothetical protein
VPGDAHVPHVATQVLVGQAIEVSGPADLDLLPPLGDRAQIGEVPQAGSGTRSSPCQRRSQTSSAPTM